MEIDRTKPVNEIVLGMPASAKVFERLGIDYCCGGNRRLEEACKAAGLEVGDVVRSLESAGSAAHTQDDAVDWSGQPLASLMNHIVEKHHTFCRQEVSRIEPLLDRVIEKHGTAHPELRRIKAHFSGLSKELLMHLIKEEQTLFPYISSMEEAAAHGIPFPKPAFGTVQNPVRMMVLEHDNAGAALHDMRGISGNYQPPPDACNSYRALYEALQSFERDMHQHVHLENNVLFPRAVAMEDAAVAGKKSAGT
ncbi:MAG: iron-sulfur cluster repair di-iron protein [Terriglobia bacterium]